MCLSIQVHGDQVSMFKLMMHVHVYYIHKINVLFSTQVSEEDAFALQTIGYVGVSISLVCLTLTVATFLFLR